MTKYFINNEEVSVGEFFDSFRSEVSEMVENGFDDYLDQVYPEYQMGSLKVLPHRIAQTDMGWYNLALDEQKEFEVDNLIYMLNEGEEFIYNNNTFRIEDVQDEEDE